MQDISTKFIPKPWARNPHLQTILGSLKVRARGRHPMTEAAKETIVDGGEGVHLLGYHSRQSSGASRGLVTLIHGWEGSSDSTYVLSMGNYLYDRGYDVFRLNLRDHGESHHLNEGLFHLMSRGLGQVGPLSMLRLFSNCLVSRRTFRSYP